MPGPRSCSRCCRGRRQRRRGGQAGVGDDRVDLLELGERGELLVAVLRVGRRGRRSARRDERIIASFNHASSRAWVVRPRPDVIPSQPRKAMSARRCDDRGDALEAEQRRACRAWPVPPVIVEVRLLDERGGDGSESVGKPPINGRLLGKPEQGCSRRRSSTPRSRQFIKAGAAILSLLVLDTDVLTLVDQRLVALLRNRHRPHHEAPDQTLVLQRRKGPSGSSRRPRRASAPLRAR